MIELTREQQQALAEEGGFPPRVVNPKTQEIYLLIHAEMYERVRALLEKEDDIASIEEMYPLVSEALDLEAKDSPKESA